MVLDDGRLTDGHGRTVNFKNAVLVMTSNVGSQHILDLDDRSHLERVTNEALRAAFRPEFLNRIDATLIFDRLDRQAIRRIVDLQLQRLAPLLDDKQLVLELTTKAKDFLADVGYDSALGARPLERAVREQILEPLAQRIISGDVGPGDVVIVEREADSLALITRRRRAA